MDALFFLKHSKHEDLEILYALRGINLYMPWVGKVWIFGDRPVFLRENTDLIEHVPHEYVARAAGIDTPVRNFFLMFHLAALIPELDFEFLWFCDDFILLDYLSEEEAHKNRYIQDLAQVTDRGTGLWKESLWRTFDLLRRLGYSGLNFETHVPTYYTKKRVFEAYSDFKDWVTEDRWFGMLGPTAILNHAYQHQKFELTRIDDEGLKAGFHHKEFEYSAIVEKCRGKKFMNFDDDAFGDDMRDYLSERFPNPSIYEDHQVSARILDRWELVAGSSAARSVNDAIGDQLDPLDAAGVENPHNNGWYPPIVLPNRNEIARLLNEQGLLGEAVEVGTLRAEFAANLLKEWKGKRLHCVDAWQQRLDDAEYVDKNNVNQSQHDRNLEIAKQRLAPFTSRCRIHQQFSKDAAVSFADASLDFVYLDALHYREALLADLEIWAPKVRSGGILAGHDYLDGRLPSGHFEVKSTVDEWAAQRRLKVVCTGEAVWRSWLIKIR